MTALILPFSRGLADANTASGPEYVRFVLLRQAMNQAYLTWLQTEPERDLAAEEACNTAIVVQQLLDLTIPPTRSLEEPS